MVLFRYSPDAAHPMETTEVMCEFLWMKSSYTNISIFKKFFSAHKLWSTSARRLWNFGTDVIVLCIKIKTTENNVINTEIKQWFQIESHFEIVYIEKWKAREFKSEKPIENQRLHWESTIQINLLCIYFYQIIIQERRINWTGK